MALDPIPNSISVEKFNTDSTGTNISNLIPNTSTNTSTKISADNIIPTISRQFITSEEKEVLSSMLDAITGTPNHVMYKEAYDRDNDGLVDIAKKSLVADVVLWDNVIGRPDIPVTKIENFVEESHKHDNKEILDKITIDNSGNITFDNKPFKLPSNVMFSNDYDVDNDGLIDRALYADSTNWENILNKPLFYMPSPHTHRVDDIDGNINATTLNFKPSSYYLTIDSEIDFNKIKGLETLKISINELLGGNASSEFDGNSINDETRIIPRYDGATALSLINPLLSVMEICYESNTNRYKIGNGINTWNQLPFEYNTPESIRFNTFVKDYYSYYNFLEDLPPTVNKIDTTILAVGNNILFNGAARGYNNTVVTIPYNATEIEMIDGNNVISFGTSLNSLNSAGNGWFGGVSYNNNVYCAPYNSTMILKINTKNKSISTIEDARYLTNKVAKYVNGCISYNNLIYFAPNTSDGVLELNPSNDTLKFYQNGLIFDTDSNCCAVISNPINNKLYFIPKKNNKIIEFDPDTKFMRVVATCNDFGILKFATAVLAPNGLIYAIPSYGYDSMMIFDPNTFEIRYTKFDTSSYDTFNSALAAPNGKIYIMPCGASSKNVIEFDISRNTSKVIYSISINNEKYGGTVLLPNGVIMCTPYTGNNLLTIDLKLKSSMPNNLLNNYLA